MHAYEYINGLRTKYVCDRFAHHPVCKEILNSLPVAIRDLYIANVVIDNKMFYELRASFGVKFNGELIPNSLLGFNHMFIPNQFAHYSVMYVLEKMARDIKQGFGVTR